MTRKQAIIRTIEILNSTPILEEEQEELINKLMSCLDELPFTKWTEAAIFDSCDQFILENRRNIRITDFTRAELPNHTVIKNRFKITAKEFRDKYYPLPLNGAGRYLASGEAQQWKELFIADFHRVKPTEQSAYNLNRARGLPTWATLGKMYGLHCWSALLAHCGLEPYKRAIKQRSSTEYSVTTISKSEQKIFDLKLRNS